MELKQTINILDKWHNGTFHQIDYVSNVSRKLLSTYIDKYEVIKEATLNARVGLNYPKYMGIDPKEDYESAYIYDVPHKVCHRTLKNGTTEYYVALYPNKHKGNKTITHIIDKTSGKEVTNVRLEDIMQPSYFKDYDRKGDKEYRKIKVSGITRLK